MTLILNIEPRVMKWLQTNDENIYNVINVVEKMEENIDDSIQEKPALKQLVIPLESCKGVRTRKERDRRNNIEEHSSLFHIIFRNELFVVLVTLCLIPLCGNMFQSPSAK